MRNLQILTETPELFDSFIVPEGFLADRQFLFGKRSQLSACRCPLTVLFEIDNPHILFPGLVRWIMFNRIA